MIGLNRQIFRFNNVRTFFLSVSNTSPSPKRKKELPKIDARKFDGITETITKELVYEMASVGDNVRVMTVRNDDLDTDNVYCSIRVGVGYDDDQYHRGYAHLLEHVICRTYETKVPNHMGWACTTMNFETIFSFTAPFDDHLRFIRAWTKPLFSSSQIENLDFMEIERGRVDNEFQEKRNIQQFTVNRASEILKVKGDVTLALFGFGNLAELSVYHGECLIKALENCRKHYCKRPLNVCVYSANEINMDDVLKSLNSGRCITKAKQKEAKEPNWKERLKDSEKQLLIVQQSANDTIQLDIIYPFHKKLSLDEEDTFEIVGDLITKLFEGQLGHVLFTKKLATECIGETVMTMNSFVVTIRLTADGLKHIRQVTSMVRDYFQFLCDNWQKIDMQPLINSRRKTIDEQSDRDYADSIARCLVRVKDPFEEEHLFRPFTSAEGQQLISEQILNNKVIRHTIAARDVDGVYDTLAANSGLAKAKGDIETESIIGTQFHCLENGLIAVPSNSRSNFTLPQFKPQFQFLPVFIITPNDEAFLALCSHYLELQTASLVTSHNLIEEGKYGIFRKDDGSIYLSFDREDSEKYSQKFHPETLIDFDYTKRSLMEEYSLIMTDSGTLARSLLKTALQNLTSNIKRDSVPLQYNVLKDMDFSKYNNHFEGLSDKERTEYKARSRKFKEKFEINSINVDESTTVTIAFLQQPKDAYYLQELVLCLDGVVKKEFRQILYTCKCDYATFGAATGILLKLPSVEEKEGQSGEVIRTFLEKKMNELVLEAIQTRYPTDTEVTKLWNYMRERQIIIQIVGYRTGSHPSGSGSFQTDFKQWFTHNEKQFERINNL